MSRTKAKTFDFVLQDGGRRSCDSCGQKKVRCDKTSPCGTCQRASIACLYLRVPKKKGPKTRKNNPQAPSHNTHKSSPSSISTDGTASREKAFDLASPFTFHIDGSSDPEMTRCHSSRSVDPVPEAMVDETSFPGFQANDGYVLSDIISPLGSIGANGSSDSSPRATTVAIPSAAFVPYVELFFANLFPIMPVLNRRKYLALNLLERQTPLTSEDYILLTALSGATMIQLNLSPPDGSGSSFSAEAFIEECLLERYRSDHLGNVTRSAVITSFYLFVYFSHLEKHYKGWYYLQEAISFAQAMDLDDDEVVSELDTEESQWSRRLFWLLFITERAYAIQRRKRTRLCAGYVKHPSIFESEEPRLMYGFVNLIKLFCAVDTAFLKIWKGRSSEHICSNTWLDQVQRKLDTSTSDITEAVEGQKLDILISRQWLHLLAWQVAVRYGIISPLSNGLIKDLHYPVQVARDVIQIASTVSQQSLDSHGIGMEQKIADIAGGLIDALTCAGHDSSEPFSRGREYLSLLLQKLSNIRGMESRYLQPLLSKAGTITALSLSPSYNFILTSDNRDRISEDITSVFSSQAVEEIIWQTEHN